MGVFDFLDADASADYAYVEAAPHQAHLASGTVGRASAYEAAKNFDMYCQRNGKPGSIAAAKEIIAGYVGEAVDTVVERKGLETVDREKAKHEGRKSVEQALVDSGDY